MIGFKKGDKVVAIKVSGPTAVDAGLKLGRHYTITGREGSTVRVEGCEPKLASSRFLLASVLGLPTKKQKSKVAVDDWKFSSGTVDPELISETLSDDNLVAVVRAENLKKPCWIVYHRKLHIKAQNIGSHKKYDKMDPVEMSSGHYRIIVRNVKKIQAVTKELRRIRAAKWVVKPTEFTVHYLNI